MRHKSYMPTVEAVSQGHHFERYKLFLKTKSKFLLYFKRLYV